MPLVPIAARFEAEAASILARHVVARSARLDAEAALNPVLAKSIVAIASRVPARLRPCDAVRRRQARILALRPLITYWQAIEHGPQ